MSTTSSSSNHIDNNNETSTLAVVTVPQRNTIIINSSIRSGTRNGSNSRSKGSKVHHCIPAYKGVGTEIIHTNSSILGRRMRCGKRRNCQKPWYAIDSLQNLVMRVVVPAVVTCQ